MRLQKYMAHAGIASRRTSERLIEQGRVTVNGEVVSTMGREVSSQDTVCVDGKRISLPKDFVYYIFYKPRGVASTCNDEKGRKCVGDYFAHVGRRVYPIGRLDYDSEGMILVTDDGSFAQQVMHPKHGVSKQYLCTLDKHYKEQDKIQALKGIDIGERRLARAYSIASKLRADGKCNLTIVLRDGMNRQIRKMMEAQGYRVLRLKRQSIGKLQIGDIKPGSYKKISYEEASLALENNKNA